MNTWSKICNSGRFTLFSIRLHGILHVPSRYSLCQIMPIQAHLHQFISTHSKLTPSITELYQLSLNDAPSLYSRPSVRQPAHQAAFQLAPFVRQPAFLSTLSRGAKCMNHFFQKKETVAETFSFFIRPSHIDENRIFQT